jgi:hypothetical protein
MPTIECIWFLLLYTSTHWWTIILKCYVYEPLVYDHGFEGLSWKWTNNVLTTFHLSLFCVCKCLKCRLVCHDVHKTSWLVHRCSKIDPMSCNHIMRHQKISRDKCACDKRDIFKCSWFCARGFTQAISKHDQLEKCIWWWTDVPNLTEKRYQCPRSAHKSFSMRSFFHLWSFSLLIAWAPHRMIHL